MTTAGWLIMLVSLSCVWGLAIWCYKKVLSTPREDLTEPPAGLGA